MTEGEIRTLPGHASGHHAPARGGRRRVLQDPLADAQLAREGFAVRPFLAAAAVAEIREAYLDIAPVDDSGLIIEYMRPDRRVVRQLSRLLEPVWRQHLDELAMEHRVVMSTFVVKRPGMASEMFLHDDRSYVDERLYRAATIWIPLVDVGPGIPNGGLQVVPRSHLLQTGWSGSNTPDVIRPWEAALRTGLIDVEAPAGSAVVYDTRVLHASRPNMTTSPRMAVVCAIAPREARLIHVFATGRRHRRIHAVDEDFFVDHHPREIEQQMPADCPIVEELDEDIRLEAKDIETLLGGTLKEPPVVVVPPDLARSGEARIESLPVSVRDSQRRGSDVHVRLDEMGAGEIDEVPVVRPEACTGVVWSTALLRRWRSHRKPPVAAERWRRDIGSRMARDVDLIVLSPGSRLRGYAPGTPRWSSELLVLEAPSVGAGILTTCSAAQLDVGTVVDVPQEACLTIWNDGPGQLVMLAARVPAPVGLLGRLLTLVDGGGIWPVK